jgi:cation diffusion facilitator family transporter
MAAFKIGVGIMSGSHALLANALYSVNDVLSSVAVSVSLRVGARRPSSMHPYGYGKAEFIAVGMVSMAIAIGVTFMFFFSVIDILRGVPGPPHFIALTLAATSMVTSWVISKKGHQHAHALRSPALATSADHHHADAEGSLLAIIGIAGAVLGLHVLDRIIAVVETLHLVALSGSLLAKSMKGLLDTAIPADDTDLLEEACSSVEGVERVAHVWSRQSGSKTWVDVAVEVSEGLKVQDAQAVCAKVEEAVTRALGRAVSTQVRFQGPTFAYVTPGPGGSPHG